MLALLLADSESKELVGSLAREVKSAYAHIVLSHSRSLFTVQCCLRPMVLFFHMFTVVGICLCCWHCARMQGLGASTVPRTLISKLDNIIYYPKARYSYVQ